MVCIQMIKEKKRKEKDITLLLFQTGQFAEKRPRRQAPLATQTTRSESQVNSIFSWMQWVKHECLYITFTYISLIIKILKTHPSSTSFSDGVSTPVSRGNVLWRFCGNLLGEGSDSVDAASATSSRSLFLALCSNLLRCQP